MERYFSPRLGYLEHRNGCAEPERERDSLGHSVQLPLRCRSAATSCQCYGRFFQNRFADDGCNRGSRRWHPNANANTYGYSELNAYCNPKADALTEVEPRPKTTGNSSAAPLAFAAVLTGKRSLPKNVFCFCRKHVREI